MVEMAASEILCRRPAVSTAEVAAARIATCKTAQLAANSGEAERRPVKPPETVVPAAISEEVALEAFPGSKTT